MLNAITGVLVLAAVFAYVNTKFIRLPMTIGIAGLALGFSLLMVAASHFGASELRAAAVAWSQKLGFSQLVLQGMLSFLLFAGALDLNGTVLRHYAWQVAFLSIVSTVCSACLVGGGMYVVSKSCGIPLSIAYCMAFGALIAPTDAVAVIGALRRSSVPESVETAVAGEALFNDGVGIVLFSVFRRWQLAASSLALRALEACFCAKPAEDYCLAHSPEAFVFSCSAASTATTSK